MGTEREIRSGGLKGNFDKLKSVIRCFKPEESKIVRHYLVLGHTEQYGGKTIALYDFLLKNQEASIVDAETALGKMSRAGFDMLISRLKEKLCFVLANENLTQRDGAYSKRFQAYFNGKDILKQFHILLARGAQEEANDRLDYIIAISKEFEWYDTLIEAYYLKLEFLKKRSETTIYEDIESRLVYAEFCRKSLYKAKVIYDDFATIKKATAVQGEHIQLAEKCLEQLEELYQRTQSATIEYQKLKVQIEYYHEKELFDKAEQTAQKLLALTNNTPSISQPQTIGVALLYLSYTLIYQGQYAASVNYALLAREKYIPNSLNYAETLELEFFASFYDGKYSKAEKAVRFLLKNGSYPSSSYLKNRRQYLLACVLFAQGFYKEAEIELSTISSITQDKNGFNIGIRILSLLICRMQSDYEMMNAREKAFVKDLERIRKHKAVRKRDLLVFAIIKELAKRNGSFDDVYLRRRSDFDLLQSNHQEYKWKAFSHEMIVFHFWFLTQLKKKQVISKELR
jgi:hypothetical protein